MDLKQMLYVLTIKELGTMTKAAEELYISQSALSISLKNLEKELGISLFEKSGRNIIATPAGEQFCKKASEILEMVDTLKADMGHMGFQQAHTIRISTGAVDFTNEAIVLFSSVMPDINCEQLRYDINRSHAELCLHHLDFVVTQEPLNDESVYSEILIHEPMYLLISTKQPLSTKSIVSMQQLSGIPIVTQPNGFSINRLVHTFFQQAQIRPGRTVEVSDPESIPFLVSKIGGISFVPESTYQYITKDNSDMLYEVNAIRLHEDFCSRTVYLSYLKDLEMHDFHHAFIRHLRQFGTYAQENRCFPSLQDLSLSELQ